MPIARNSKQRNAIFSELRSRVDHPTADELYRSLKKDYPALSLGTVYRNLKQLTEDGKVLCIRSETSDRFDATVTPHYHLLCRECHRLYDFDIPDIPDILSRAADNYGGQIDTYSLIYTGVCLDCLEKTENQTVKKAVNS